MSKKVMITGANGGIGRAIARRFAAGGEDLLLCVRQEQEEFSDYVERLRQEYGVKATVYYFDMLDERAMSAAMHQIRKQEKTVDVLVNNAGIPHGGLFQMTSVEEMKQIMDVNYFSAVRLSQMVTRLMVHSKTRGAIVNIASIAGLDVDLGNCAYGVSKAALIAFTKTVAKELAPAGIRVNAVAPGLTDTRMADSMKGEGGQRMINASSMKRLAKPEEIAETVFFLSSEQASFVTGQVLRVDGGM